MGHVVPCCGGDAMTISIVDQDVFTALRTFITSVLPAGTEVVQSQDNGVPMPIGGFVAMNNAGTKRLSTNIGAYTTGTKSVTASLEYSIQLDFYGADASAWANIVQVMFRDQYATDLLPVNIQPLYADDPMQIPLINGEGQYEQRWKLTAVLQYNPIIAAAQQSATSLTIGLKEIESTFHP
jgi:hypothetical protein